MKKLFVAICSALPGGFLLLVVMVLFVGCAHFQAQTDGFRMEGITGSPETVALSLAQSEAIRAEAYATRKCSDDPKHCGAVYGGWGMGGMMDTPAGYTWAGIRAAGGTGGSPDSGDIRKDVADIKKTVRAMDKGQDAFFQTLKNRKKGK